MSEVTINFVMLQAVVADLADGDVDIVLPSADLVQIHQ